MNHVSLVSVVVRDYDEALSFYVDKLGFTLVEDKPVPEQNKRWVVVRPRGAPSNSSAILLARASNEEQLRAIGNQTGGRVFLFLQTDNFDRDYKAFTAAGVEWVRPPAVYSYGTVAVFRDLYGNQWDLLEMIGFDVSSVAPVSKPAAGMRDPWANATDRAWSFTSALQGRRHGPLQASPVVWKQLELGGREVALGGQVSEEK